MAQDEDKGFFDKLNEILNAPLPGTQTRAPQDQTPAEDQDDDSLMGRIRDILNTPLPGTAQAENANQTAGKAPGKQAHNAGEVPGTVEKTPELDEDDLDEAWWKQDWAGFRSHQQRERDALELKQRTDLEKFQAYQQQEKQRFEAHQWQENTAFTQRQQWRLNAWHQEVARNPGQKPPPPPWDLPPGGQMQPPGFPPGQMAGGPWMPPPGPGRRG